LSGSEHVTTADKVGIGTDTTVSTWVTSDCATWTP
jgi:hypothetical protein